MRIELTEKHIKQGEHCTCNCPVALALSDKIFETVDVDPTGGIIYIGFFSGRIIDIRMNLLEIIRKYDSTDSMLPITMEYNELEAWIDLAQSSN